MKFSDLKKLAEETIKLEKALNKIAAHDFYIKCGNKSDIVLEIIRNTGVLAKEILKMDRKGD